MKTLTSSERSALIKLASVLPKSSENRKVVLASLKTSGLNWQPVMGAALEKVVRVFGAQFRDRTNLEGNLYAVKVGRKTVFALDFGVIRLYAAGDDGQIYSLKVYSNLQGINLEIIRALTSAAALGMTEDAIDEGIYTNGRLNT